MTTNQKTLSLGAVVEKLFEQAEAVAENGVAAADLAACRLERVLARGANARLAAAVADLAREIAPVTVAAARRSQSGPGSRCSGPNRGGASVAAF